MELYFQKSAKIVVVKIGKLTQLSDVRIEPLQGQSVGWLEIITEHGKGQDKTDEVLVNVIVDKKKVFSFTTHIGMFVETLSLLGWQVS